MWLFKHLLQDEAMLSLTNEKYSMSEHLLISALSQNLEMPEINEGYILGQINRVFANGLRDRGSIPVRVMPKTQKMLLDAALLGKDQG